MKPSLNGPIDGMKKKQTAIKDEESDSGKFNKDKENTVEIIDKKPELSWKEVIRITDTEDDSAASSRDEN